MDEESNFEELQSGSKAEIEGLGPPIDVNIPQELF